MVVGGFPSDIFWSVEGTAVDPFNFEYSDQIDLCPTGACPCWWAVGCSWRHVHCKVPPSSILYTRCMCVTIQSSFGMNGKNY